MEEKLEFEARVADDTVKVRCSSNGAEVDKTLRVLHHSVSVTVNGDLLGGYLKSEDIIVCTNTGGGYPTPAVSWSFINEERNISKFFDIKNDTHQSVLRVLDSAVEESRWSVLCSATNYIPPLDKGGPSTSVIFTIGATKKARLHLYLVIEMSAIIVEIFALLLAVIMGVNVCIWRKCQRRRTIIYELMTDKMNSLGRDASMEC